MNTLMKKYLVILLLSLIYQIVSIGQCKYSGNVWEESWASCNVTPSPNPIRPSSHWILFELETLHHISESHIWNANRTGESITGAKEIIVDYTSDGSTWVELGTYTLTQGDETDNYLGEAGPNFNNLPIVKILFTIVETFEGVGAGCASIAEVQFDINPDCVVYKNIVEDYDPGVSAYEEVGLDITATNVINANATVTYDAGESIELGTGFEVVQQAVFTAKIDGCDDDPNSLDTEQIDNDN